MIYLSGGVPPNLPSQIGLMLTPHMGNNPKPGQLWGADNGCFTRPHDYSDEMYLKWLAKKEPWRENCLFATAPDVVGDARATLERSRPVFQKLRAAGYRPAIVGQDGMLPDDVPWEEIDCVFLGGTTEWKLGQGAADLAAAANERGKWVHMGRVNSTKRILIAHHMGCHSADGTCLAFGADANLPKILKGLAIANGQMAMFGRKRQWHASTRGPLPSDRPATGPQSMPVWGCPTTSRSWTSRSASTRSTSTTRTSTTRSGTGRGWRASTASVTWRASSNCRWTSS